MATSVWSNAPGSEALGRGLWLDGGIPTSAIRHDLYSRAIRQSKPRSSSSGSHIPAHRHERIQDRIRMELAIADASYNAGILEQVLRYHSAIEVDDYQPGSVQLMELFIREFNMDHEFAHNVMCQLHMKTASYMENSQVLLRRDCLLLSELIVSHQSSLGTHFNSIGFDVIDLTDLVCLWACPLFVYNFPRLFTLRCIDLLLCRGPQSCNILYALAYGIFEQFAGPLSVLHTSDDLYDFLCSLPSTLTPRDIDRIFSTAGTLLNNSEDKIMPETSLDWVQLVEQAGLPRFVPGLTAAASDVQHGIKHGNVRTILDRYETTSLSGCVPNQISSLALDSNQDSSLKSKLQQSEAQLKAQASKIDRLEKELLLLESRSHQLPAATSFVKGGLQNMIPSDLVRELKARQTAANELVPPSTVSQSVSSNSARYRELSFGSMTEVYSRSYRVLQFPCIYIEGFLMKLSRPGIFGGQVLNQRFFICKGPFLTYTKSADQTKPSKDRCVNIHSASIVALDGHPRGPFAFTISVAEDQFVLFAQDNASRAKWIGALTTAASS